MLLAVIVPVIERDEILERVHRENVLGRLGAGGTERATSARTSGSEYNLNRTL
jgi:hypothetical protein